MCIFTSIEAIYCSFLDRMVWTVWNEDGGDSKCSREGQVQGVMSLLWWLSRYVYPMVQNLGLASLTAPSERGNMCQLGMLLVRCTGSMSNTMEDMALDLSTKHWIDQDIMQKRYTEIDIQLFWFGLVAPFCVLYVCSGVKQMKAKNKKWWFCLCLDMLASELR